jgi:hypothetical protein
MKLFGITLTPEQVTHLILGGTHVLTDALPPDATFQRAFVKDTGELALAFVSHATPDEPGVDHMVPVGSTVTPNPAQVVAGATLDKTIDQVIAPFVAGTVPDAQPTPPAAPAQ